MTAHEQSLETIRAKIRTTPGFRQRKTHVIWHDKGISNPQHNSIRGQILQYIKTHHAAEVMFAIAEIADGCKSILEASRSSSLNDHLGKLQRAGHLTMLTEAEALAKSAALETAASEMKKENWL